MNAGIPQETLLAYVDILGYKKLLPKMLTNSSLLNGIEEILRAGTIGLQNRYQCIPEKENYSDQNKKSFGEFLSSMNTRVVSDSIIFTLIVGNKAPDELTGHAELFLRHISAVCRSLIGKTGLLVRGCIAKGLHYENTNDPRFLFFASEGFLKAYDLVEKKKPNNFPTAVVLLPDEELAKWLEACIGSKKEEFFYTDENYQCLDLYVGMQKDDFTAQVLSNIQNGVSLNYAENKNDDAVKKKILNFARFHNTKINTLGYPAMRIDL